MPGNETPLRLQSAKLAKSEGGPLMAFNVRTNHVHTVVSANRCSKLVLNAFKANATRQLRQDGLWLHNFGPWVRKGSRIKLWNERSIARAIDYVLYGQGDDLPRFDE